MNSDDLVFNEVLVPFNGNNKWYGKNELACRSATLRLGTRTYKITAGQAEVEGDLIFEIIDDKAALD